MRTATACHGDLKTLFSILSTCGVNLELDRHLDEPEVYAIYPQQAVIGWTWLDSRSAGLAESMLRSLHKGHALYHSVVIE